jgi:hypothetical protein
VSAFHADVVVDAHAGQHRDLFPAQPLYPTVATVGRQARLLRGDPGPPGYEEVVDLRTRVHTLHRMRTDQSKGGTGVTCKNRNSPGVPGRP